jgi:hypothetical protein
MAEIGLADKSAPGLTQDTSMCQRCSADLGGADLDSERYTHGGLRLCEDCYIDLWRPHHRKPHWCYIKSIKSDYLKPAPDG